MLHVVKEKRLNDFKEVRCIKPRDLYFRIGRRVPDTSFASSDISVPLNMDKIQSIEFLEKYDAYQSELDRQKQTVNDSSVNQHLKNDDSSGEA